MRPRVLIPWLPGTNCHEETAYAFRKAGARPQIKTIVELRRSPELLVETDLIALPGGFADGDHFDSGQIAALEFAGRFRDQWLQVLDKKIPVIGICNGFQILVRMGLLPGDELGKPKAVMDFNLCGRFEHRHSVTLVLHEASGCVWTSGLGGMTITVPVGHGEGRPVITGNVNVIATYGTAEGDSSFEASPNGSPTAGICSDSGLVMGMMPHPERRVDELHGGSDGLLIFQAGVRAVT